MSPVHVYKPQGPDIGVVDGPFEYLTVAGIELPLPFTTRMTVVRLSNGDLFLHSPIKFAWTVAEELRNLGRIRHLVSPNQFHWVHVFSSSSAALALLQLCLSPASVLTNTGRTNQRVAIRMKLERLGNFLVSGLTNRLK